MVNLQVSFQIGKLSTLFKNIRNKTVPWLETTYIHQVQQTNTCWRSTIETLQQDVKYVQSQCLIIRTTSFNSFWFLLENLCYSTLSTPEQNDVIALLSLFLILNISYLLLVVLLSTLNIHLFSEFDLFIFQLLLALNKSSTHL